MKRISRVYIVNSLIRTMCIGRTLNQHLQLSIETIRLFENRNRQIEKGSLSLEYVAPPQTLPILTSSEKRATAQGWTRCSQTERAKRSGARPRSLDMTRHGWGGCYRCPRCPSKNFGCINWLRPAGLTQGNALQCLTSEMGNHAAGVGVGTTPTQPSNSSVHFLIGPTTLEPNLRLFEWYHKLDSLFVYFLYVARIHDLGML